MGDGTEDEEEEEDGGDWDVDGDCGHTAKRSIGGRVGRFEVVWIHAWGPVGVLRGAED